MRHMRGGKEAEAGSLLFAAQGGDRQDDQRGGQRGLHPAAGEPPGNRSLDAQPPMRPAAAPQAAAAHTAKQQAVSKDPEASCRPLHVPAARMAGTLRPLHVPAARMVGEVRAMQPPPCWRCPMGPASGCWRWPALARGGALRQSGGPLRSLARTLRPQRAVPGVTVAAAGRRLAVDTSWLGLREREPGHKPGILKFESLEDSTRRLTQGFAALEAILARLPPTLTAPLHLDLSR